MKSTKRLDRGSLRYSSPYQTSHYPVSNHVVFVCPVGGVRFKLFVLGMVLRETKTPSVGGGVHRSWPDVSDQRRLLDQKTIITFSATLEDLGPSNINY